MNSFLSSNLRSLFPIVLVLTLMGAGTSRLQAILLSGSLIRTDCYPGAGWRWTPGPAQPEVAAEIQWVLDQVGIESNVAAAAFGEIDSCGHFKLYANDLTIEITGYADKETTQPGSQKRQDLSESLSLLLAPFSRPNPGNVHIILPDGDSFMLNREAHESKIHNPKPEVEHILTRKVFVVVYDPLLSNGQLLSAYLNWNSHAVLTQQTVDFFQENSNGRLQFEIVFTSVITSGWPEKVDGFIYTEEEYLAVSSGQSPPHMPDNVNYNKIVNDPDLDICGKLNQGEIDEVWIYNGPYFGFYESTLAGPGAYWYNSPPVPEPTSCNRLVPIMGPSPERGLAETIHNFGHRMESTMAWAYGSWQQNQTNHNWERFALVKALSPNYSYSGCGNIHYPPNAASDYDYVNPNAVLSNCDDFWNYPNLSDPLTVALPVTCSAWNCDHTGFMAYWFNHLPASDGCDIDEVGNNWWSYFVDPAFIANCEEDPTPTPTATPIHTPTATPTHTPTATPTHTPTATLTPSPTPVAGWRIYLPTVWR